MEDIFFFLCEVREHEYESDLHELDWLDRWNSWDIEPSSGTIVLLTDKKYCYEEDERSSEDSFGVLFKEGIWNLGCDCESEYTDNNIHEVSLEVKVVVPFIELAECDHALRDRIGRIDTYRTHHNQSEYDECEYEENKGGIDMFFFHGV